MPQKKHQTRHFGKGDKLMTRMARMARRTNQSLGDKVFDFTIYIILILAFVVVAYPLTYIVSASFSSTKAVMAGRVWLWPVEPTFYAYTAVFKNQSILTGYVNSFIYTLLGTAINLVMCMLCAFPLARKHFVGKGVFNALLIFTMFFSGGLIPTYLVINNLHMLNTLWVMILPGAMNVWFVILMRTYLKSSIPEELYESAELDGCGVMRMLPTIAIPLSGPIIAVIALYCAVGIWGSYFDAFIYLTKKELYPLQVVLRNILILSQVDPSMLVDAKELAMRQGLINVLKFAIIVVASLPPLLIYPFVQKYFVKGIMIGSLKG